MTFTGVVAIDGPSGTGKSTVAKRLAGRLGARYLDTGAMYRAAALAVLRAGVDPDDPAAVLEIVRAVSIEVTTDPEGVDVLLDGERVNREIRTPEVTVAVSPVSAVPEVRTILVDAQREIIGAGGIVVEGRDIGSVVWPTARPKIYLTASSDARAVRRATQIGSSNLDHVATSLERRDQYDSTRAASPLLMSDDAVEVDTTELDIDGVVDHLVALVSV